MKSILIKLTLILIIFTGCESQLDYSGDRDYESGTGGSLARFTISGNYLYAVDYQKLSTFDISDEKNPVLLGVDQIDILAETIFAYEDLLLIGTRGGVFIYSISDPSSPEFLSISYHSYSCDPVVAKGNYAYATLNSVSGCNTYINELRIIDISNPSSPDLVEQIAMDSPKGLGISGNLLFVCDNQIKSYDISAPTVPLHLSDVAINAF